MRVNVHFINIMSVRAPSSELPEQKVELNYGLGTPYREALILHLSSF